MSKAKEVNTEEMEIRQKPDVVMLHGVPYQRNPEIMVLAEKEPLTKEYLDQLAFNEEEITILISQASERFAPKFIDIWCDGKGAEVLEGNKWQVRGALPVGYPVTTKRKYVEILANSKIDTITTPHLKPGDDPDDRVGRQTSSRAVFSVVKDANPKGQEWLRRILYFN